MNINKEELTDSAEKGNIDILIKCLKHLKKCGYGEIIIKSVVIKFINSAIRNNHLTIIKYIIANNLYLDYTAKYAALKNNLEIIKLLHNNGFKLNQVIGFIAAGSGSKKILEFLEENNIEINHVTFLHAVNNNQSECVEYLYGINCNINVKLCRTNNIEIKKWLEERKIIIDCDYDSDYDSDNSDSNILSDRDFFYYGGNVDTCFLPKIPSLDDFSVTI